MRRAMTCVYCEPKSRMTICSVIENEGSVLLAAPALAREKFEPNIPASIEAVPL
jgi:hypothetical protein